MLQIANGKQQFIDQNGAPLAGGQVYHYAPGTTNPVTTYKDQAGQTTNTNPILLDSRGQATIWATGTIRQVVTDPLGVTIWDQLVSAPDILGGLSQSTGATKVGYGTDTVAAALDALHLVDYTALRAYAGPQKSVFITGYLATKPPLGIAGLFVRDDSDTTTADNGGTCIVSQSGVRWKRPTGPGVKAEWFGAVGDGVADDTIPLARALAAIPVGGAVELMPGNSYRITLTLSLVAQAITCTGKATIIADLNDATKDAIFMNSLLVRAGTAQDYVPSSRLEGVIVLVHSTLRDGIRVASGDYPVLNRVDVQREAKTSPTWRDGVHVEPAANGCFIENLDFRSVRVHDAGRDGFRFEVPATGTNVFINVGSYDNCEVRGCGIYQPGYPVHFVSLNTSAPEKISSHTFTGGEYQTNSTATNPNPDGFRADKVAGGANIENIHINGATAECVPTNGTGLAVNTNAMTRVVLTNFLPFGFTGAGTGVGGTGDYVTFGYLGLDAYVSHGTWNIALSGATTAGAPTVSFQKGIYTRVGKTVTIAGQIQISSWGGAVGQIIVGGLPASVKNDPFAFYGNVPSQINGVALGAGYTYPALRARYATNTLALVKNGSSVNDSTVNVADATAPFSLAFSLTYETD